LLRLAPLSAKLKKQSIEGRDRSVFFSLLAGLISIQQCDRNSPFVQLNQLELAGVEIGTYRAQGIRHTVKIRKATRVGALRSPGLGQLFNVYQA
jgi:hypothetical protein